MRGFHRNQHLFSETRHLPGLSTSQRAARQRRVVDARHRRGVVAAGRADHRRDTLALSLHRDRRARQTTLFSDLFGAAIYIATALIILNSVFALPVTGLLATSGVLAIVLGLALQNTLADVFAGMAVGVEAPFGVGDRIQIDNKIEGQVVQVNWRSIRIQTDGDDIAIIPTARSPRPRSSTEVSPASAEPRPSNSLVRKVHAPSAL